jgi:DNA (cytosine-5)-methyltransferase 1
VSQPNYPFEFVQADAMEYPLDGFDMIHASPPCQAFSRASGKRKNEYPDLLTPIIVRLQDYASVVENVPQSPIRKDILLCGEMFGLCLHRHRYFEIAGFVVPKIKHPKHLLRAGYHNCHVEEGYTRVIAGHFSDITSAQKAMGIDWMSGAELAQAIPPAYTEWIGVEFLRSQN